MSDILSIALSGLNAQTRKIEAAANNIANVSTGGTVPTGDSASTVYKPLHTQFISQGDAGGVFASVTEDPNGYSVIFDPDSPYANEEGLVAVPNVDLVTESVNILEAKTAFTANLKVIKTHNDMLGELIDDLF